MLVHLAALTMAFLSGRVPDFSISLSATALTLMLVGVLISSARLAAFAAALAPAAGVLLVAALVAPSATVTGLQGSASSWWLPVHLGLVFSGLAAFVLEFVAAAFEDVLRRRLKRKDLASMGQLPALDLVALVQRRALLVGLVALGLGVVAGSAWAAADAASGWALSPKVAVTGAVWVHYLVTLGLRQRFGWQGRWSVALSAAGLAMLVFSFVGLDFLVGGFHAYGG